MYLISDTHFNHSNIIRYCNRPFSGVAEMNRVMIERWNSVVQNTDKIIFVGDFCMGNPAKWAPQLKGLKICVRGNHDPSPQKLMDSGFDFVVESMTIKYNGKLFLIRHYPIEPESARLQILEEIGADAVIHGHQHNHTPLISGQKQFNVSCENLDYTPIHFSEIIKLL